MSMLTTIQLSADHARHLARWKKLQADPELAKLPYKIETDRLDRIIMSPPPSLTHGSRQFRIAGRLAAILPEGQVITECPLVTADGIKAIDVAWLGAGRTEVARGELVLQAAPEICVEVLSPSNTEEKMAEQRALYFEAAAREV